MSEKVNAEVLAVYPHKIIVSVNDLKDFTIAEEKLAVGSYLKICDDTKCGILSVIENFRIEQDDKAKDGRKHILETVPLAARKILRTFSGWLLYCGLRAA